jgi:hypothetical protein
MLAKDEFLVAGSGIIITFAVRGDNGAIAGIGMMEEGRFVDGRWSSGRRMNGDQSHQGRHTHLPGDSFSMQKVKLYKYR